MNPIIRMITRMAMLFAVEKGIEMGAKHMSRRKQAGRDLTPEEEAEMRRQEGESSKRMKQAMRIGRRFGRF